MIQRVVGGLRSLAALFIEDGPLASAIALWLAVTAAAAVRYRPSSWSGTLLFCGLAAILIGSVLASARKA